jgi:hypothetical protein
MMEKNGKVELGKTRSEFSSSPSDRLIDGVPVRGEEEAEAAKVASEKKMTAAAGGK